VQRSESVRLFVAVPTGGQEPYPLLLWEQGTGADLFDALADDPVLQEIDAGFALAVFEPQFHGSRGDGSDPTNATFNVSNPEAARTVFRQQAVDTATFVRVLREALPGQADLPALDTDHVLYGGHSQGALVGALVAAVEPTMSAYVLNGVGADLSITIAEREDPVDFN